MAFITSSNPFFVKLILDHTLVQGKFDIPKKFVVNNGGGGSLFHETATLRLPSGAIWEVQVEKSGGKVSFSRGWPDFVKFYSVRSGYLIIFKLVGYSCFDVSIIHWSSAGIDYPNKLQINNGGSSGLAPSLVVKIESESDEETDSCRNMRKKMKENKKQLTVAQRFSDEDEYEDEDEDLEMEMDFSKKQSNVRGSGSNHGDDDDDPESMRPKNPRKTPSFIVTMTRSYIQT